MRGLLKHQWYTTKLAVMLWLGVSMALWFIFAFFQSVRQNYFFSAYPFLLISFLPMASLSQDSSERWDVYASSLPVSREQVVSAKYIFALVLAAVSGLLFLLVNLTSRATFRNPQWELVFHILIIGICTCLTGPSAALPVCFRFSSNSPARFLSIFLNIFVINTLVMLFDVPAALADALLLLFSTAIFGFSWFLSIRLYKKRDL